MSKERRNAGIEGRDFRDRRVKLRAKAWKPRVTSVPFPGFLIQRIFRCSVRCPQRSPSQSPIR